MAGRMNMDEALKARQAAANKAVQTGRLTKVIFRNRKIWIAR
jgi:hypothetical protein